MNPKDELVREWLTLADDDLRIAELAMKDIEPVCWAATFHSQQAAEKTLKAFLAYHEFHVEKTHDIEFLLGLCRRILPEMEQFIEKGSVLTAMPWILAILRLVLRLRRNRLMRQLK